MKKITLLAAICLMFAASLQAHSITPIQLKQARMAVYQWIEEYLACAYLSDKYDRNDYSRLFANSNVLVVNDYLPITNDEQVLLSEYLELYSRPDVVYTPTIETHKESIRVKSESLLNGYYICVISIGKSIYFSDSANVYSYPSKDYLLNTELQYDFSSSMMKCIGIHTSDSLYVDGVLHTDDGDNCYISLKDTTELVINKEKYPIIVTKNIKHLPFDKKMIHVRKDTLKHSLHFGASIGSSIISHRMLNNDFNNYSTHPALSWDIHVGLYHQFLLKCNNRFGIEYSLLFRSNKYSFDGQYYTSYNTIDPDGGSYLRHINVDNYKEYLQLYSISIPISLRYDNFIHPNITIFGTLGVFVAYDIAQSAVASAQSKYAGYYDWLYNITINQNGIYDFGAFTIEKSSNQTAFNRLNLGALTSLGAQFFIPNSHWSVETSIYYQMSLYNPIKHVDYFHLTENSNHWQSASFLFDNLYKHNIQIQCNFLYNF